MIRTLRFAGGAIFGSALIASMIVLVHLQGAPKTVAAAIAVAPAPIEEETPPAPVFQDADPAMAVARSRSQATLDTFFIERDLPGVTEASLLVTVVAPDLDDGFENVWMSRCRETNPGRFTCIVDDSPLTRHLRLGDRHAFERDAIADWRYVDAVGRIHGGYSIRANLPTMEETERAAIIPRLAPLPPG